MILTLTGSDFTLDAGFYYSHEFRQDEKDTLITVGMWLDANGTVSMQESLDGVDWIDVPDSTITCSPIGLQTFIDAHFDLFYRIKADQIVTKAQILI